MIRICGRTQTLTGDRIPKVAISSCGIKAVFMVGFGTSSVAEKVGAASNDGNYGRSPYSFPLEG